MDPISAEMSFQIKSQQKKNDKKLRKAKDEIDNVARARIKFLAAIREGPHP